MLTNNIVTIDGTPGAGKTTQAELIAKAIGGIHLDSGALFRCITWYCMQNGIDLKNPDDVIYHLPLVKIQFSDEKHFVCGKNVSEFIRKPHVTKLVCLISNLPAVRTFVKNFQLECAKEGKVVCDGRKVGTEVFPDAKVKFYLDARPEVRALRRYRQFLAKDKNTCYVDVFNDLTRREEIERNNGILLVPENAIIIDNSDQTVEETLNIMLSSIL